MKSGLHSYCVHCLIPITSPHTECNAYLKKSIIGISHKINFNIGLHIHVISAMINTLLGSLLFSLSTSYIVHVSDIVEQHLVLFASEISILN